MNVSHHSKSWEHFIFYKQSEQVQFQFRFDHLGRRLKNQAPKTQTDLRRASRKEVRQRNLI